MLGWILGAIAVGCVCSAVNDSRNSRNERDYYQSRCRDLEYENSHLRRENRYLRVTFNNHMSLLADYDRVTRSAKSIGHKGAVDFFYYSAEYHDSRFEHFARFLNKVRHVRNDVAHNGMVYDIDQGFLDKLSCCVKVCQAHRSLPYGRTLYLN